MDPLIELSDAARARIKEKEKKADEQFEIDTSRVPKRSRDCAPNLERIS